MHKIVLLRHGESTWNQENHFTGWTDVGLTDKGLAEARAAGQLLKREGYDFDVTFTSVLRRAIKTLWTALDEMDRIELDNQLKPIRHYYLGDAEAIKASMQAVANQGKATLAP